MDKFDSGTMKLDLAGVRFRAFDLRIRNVEQRIIDLRAGATGAKGEAGQRGVQGQPGPMGPMPKHRWDGSKLQFQQGPDGDTWGPLVDLQGPPGEQKIYAGVVPAAQTSGWFPAGW